MTRIILFHSSLEFRIYVLSDQAMRKTLVLFWYMKLSNVKSYLYLDVDILWIPCAASNRLQPENIFCFKYHTEA